MGAYAVVFALGLIGALVLAPLVRRIAFSVGAIDLPGGRRLHAVPTARLGGCVIYASVAIALGAAAVTNAVLARPLAQLGGAGAALGFGATLMLIVGAVDDIRSLGARQKLVAETVAALLAVLAGCRIGAIAGVELHWLAIPATMLWIVAVTNAVNMNDGLDGLAVGAGAIAAAALFAISLAFGNFTASFLLAALCGALLGFLRYNFTPATIFLGDSGSLLMGFVLAVLAIQSPLNSAPPDMLPISLLVLGLPLVELTVTVLRRLLRSLRVYTDGYGYHFALNRMPGLFVADREHIHHRLLALGLTPRSAVLTLYLACAIFGAAAVAAMHWREANQLAALMGLSCAAIIGVRRLDYRELRALKNGLLLPIFTLLSRAIADQSGRSFGGQSQKMRIGNSARTSI